MWLVDDPETVPGIAALGPDALMLSAEDLAGVLAGQSGRIKTVITDQKVIAGIGNAYSDEILHVAKLSPFATAGKLTDAQLAALHDAMISVLTNRSSERSAGSRALRSGNEARMLPPKLSRARMFPAPISSGRRSTIRSADRRAR